MCWECGKQPGHWDLTGHVACHSIFRVILVLITMWESLCSIAPNGKEMAPEVVPLLASYSAWWDRSSLHWRDWLPETSLPELGLLQSPIRMGPSHGPPSHIQGQIGILLHWWCITRKTMGSPKATVGFEVWLRLLVSMQELQGSFSGWEVHFLLLTNSRVGRALAHLTFLTISQHFSIGPTLPLWISRASDSLSGLKSLFFLNLNLLLSQVTHKQFLISCLT